MNTNVAASVSQLLSGHWLFQSLERAASVTTAAAVLYCISLSAGCGCQEVPGASAFTSAGNQTESLNLLGVNTEQTPRVDNGGTTIPESYNPLGTTRRVGAKMELFFAGAQASIPGKVATLYQDFSCLADTPPCTKAEIDAKVLDTRTQPEAPWIPESLNSNANPETRRAVTGADIDGDGFEELVTAYVKGNEIRLNIIDDDSAQYTKSDVKVGTLANVRDISIAGGDFDGDGLDELVVGLCGPAKVTLWFLGDQKTGFLHDTKFDKDFTRLITDSSVSFSLAAGNIDYDNAHELAVVLNEIKGTCGTPLTDSRQFIYDDQGTTYTELSSGPIQGRDQSGVIRTAIVCDVDMGDIDGDGLDEILLAGLTVIPGCSINDSDDKDALLIARDDAVEKLVPVGVRSVYFSPGGSSIKIRFLHVNALDIDGDQRAEIQVNQFVFEDWAQADPWTKVDEYSLSTDLLFGEWNEPNTYAYDKTTSAAATGDVTGDGRDDVVVTGWFNGVPQILIFSVNESSDPPAIQLMHRIATQNGSNPILVAADVDIDGDIVKYQEGSHSLVFTEPIILAVLAAPPCIEGEGQNSDACVTSFGNSSSIGTEEERSFKVSAGVSAGIDVADRTFTQSAFKLKASLKLIAGLSASRAYTLEKSVVRTSGPMEDSVIFMTQPMDRYLYTVISSVDPGLIGKTIDIWLPRETVIVLVEREFYNNSVTEGSVRVDESILRHRIGNPSSYPTRGEKNEIMSGQILYGVTNPLLQNGPQLVGQGTGEIELGIDVSEEFSAGASLAMEFELEVETTIATVEVGVSFGFEAEATWSLTTGTSTSYSGTVGNLSAASFGPNQYSFGLFTYRHLHLESGQQFQVINYWVE